jgi:hypothetical protein
MSSTTVATCLVPSGGQGPVVVLGARCDYPLVVTGSSGRVEVFCSTVGLTAELDAASAQRLSRYLLDAAAVLARGHRGGHLRAIGSTEVLIRDHGIETVDIDVVRDDAEDVHAVLISLDGLGLEGTLDEAAARRLGAQLLSC